MQATRHRIAAILCASAAVTAASAQPDIGGTPIHTEMDTFSNGALWGMTTWSYVYDADSVLPSGFALGAGEMLFAYLLDADEALTVSIDTFSVGNPEMTPVTSVGYETSIVPPGYDGGAVEEPYLYGYSGPAQATIYTYAGDFSDPFSTLDPGEWSLVWYITEAPTWTLGSATASGAGIGDNQLVPVGAIPSPGVLGFLALAGLTGRRRR